MKKHIVLFRPDKETEDEYQVCQKNIETYTSRTAVPPNSLVIGRYSVLPFYKELDTDLTANGSHLINSYSEHVWIADLQQWYPYFEDITPKTWFSLYDALQNEGPYVVKGQTNSKKFEWDTHMYAEDKNKLREVYMRCMDDSLLGSQSVYVRQYIPLKRLATGLRGLPISNEHRTFFLDGQPIASGFYWSNYFEDVKDNIVNPPTDFLLEIGSRLKARFVVADVAQTESGDWTLVELNDGQMSGLSEVNTETLYRELDKRLRAKNA
jgi:hypothetical protein